MIELKIRFRNCDCGGENCPYSSDEGEIGAILLLPERGSDLAQLKVGSAALEFVCQKFESRFVGGPSKDMQEAIMHLFDELGEKGDKKVGEFDEIGEIEINFVDVDNDADYLSEDLLSPDLALGIDEKHEETK